MQRKMTKSVTLNVKRTIQTNLEKVSSVKCAVRLSTKTQLICRLLNKIREECSGIIKIRVTFC